MISVQKEFLETGNNPVPSQTSPSLSLSLSLSPSLSPITFVDIVQTETYTYLDLLHQREHPYPCEQLALPSLHHQSSLWQLSEVRRRDRPRPLPHQTHRHQRGCERDLKHACSCLSLLHCRHHQLPPLCAYRMKGRQ